VVPLCGLCFDRAMTRVQLAVLGAALAVTSGGVFLAFTSDHEENAAFVVAGNLIAAWAFIGSGLYAWSRRPENRFGVLMTAVGLAWFVGALSESNSSIPFTLGVAFGGLFLAVFLHALMVFPRGYLETKLVYFAVVTVYALVLVASPVATLFEDTSKGCAKCPPNAFLVHESDTVVTVIEVLALALAIPALAIAAWVLIRRWRAASKPLRRALGPVYTTAGATIALLFLTIAVSAANDSVGEILWWILLFVFASVPLSFLAGLLRTRLARASVGRLVEDLADARRPREIRTALGRALGDPFLRLGYWLPDSETYVDEAGRPFELADEVEGAATTPVEHEGELVAVLIHDPTLTDQPEFLAAVAAAASLALARERSLQALRGSERRYRALLNAIPDLMFRMSRDGVYLDFKGEREDLSVPPEELLGRTVHDVLPREVADLVLMGVRAAIDAGTVVTGEYELALGGVPRYFEARIVKDGSEAVIIVRDITERKKHEAQLRRSRARIVEAGDVERRRLERNLHDGAQQRLVSLSLALRLAQAQVAANPKEAERILSAASNELGQALEELRELARGIHPAVLTDRGLGPALEALAARAPLRVDLALAEERLPDQVEAAAYYVVSEALANVVKYAEASAVAVRVARDNGRAVVEVADDGVGGANPESGSGLRGLADRVEALDGLLEVESRPGGGTRIRAEIPCG
jgi:PAS domain S-box-containing protein